jgi:hypothetical protein
MRVILSIGLTALLIVPSLPAHATENDSRFFHGTREQVRAACRDNPGAVLEEGEGYTTCRDLMRDTFVGCTDTDPNGETNCIGGQGRPRQILTGLEVRTVTGGNANVPTAGQPPGSLSESTPDAGQSGGALFPDGPPLPLG